MSTLKYKYPSLMLPVGTRVKSIKIGTRDEFEGVITAHFNGSYHVADANGDGWQRDRKELSVIQEALAA